MTPRPLVLDLTSPPPPPPLAAKDGRDDPASGGQQAARQRDEKAEHISPPQKSPVEKALAWYDANGERMQWRGIHFSGGNFPGGAGMGYGIGVTRQGIGSPVADPDSANRIDGDLFAARSARGYQRFAARMDVRNVGAKPIDLSLSWQDYRLTQEDFYGLGPDSDEDHHTNYRNDGSDYGVGLTWRPSDSWAFG